MSSGSLSDNNTRSLVVNLVTVALAAGMAYYSFRKSQESAQPQRTKKSSSDEEHLENGSTNQKPNKTIKFMDDATSYPSLMKNSPRLSPVKAAPPAEVPPIKEYTPPSSEEINKLIEEADKKGKAFFKAKQYLQAASCFTEALDILAKNSPDGNSSSSKKQVITLTNNRSAMYEKGGLPELVLEDCERILELDLTHQKARLRKLRVLESQDRFQDALVEVCALQLKFMGENRQQLRLGIPVTPPIPQSKVEELMAKILVDEVPRYFKELTAKRKAKADEAPLPSVYTILQLLKSFSGYNSWMAAAAREEDVATLCKNVHETETNSIEKAKWMFKRGKRYAYENKFDLACRDFKDAYEYVMKEDNGENIFGSKEDFTRLLDWVGMCNHLRYNLDAATECYERCSKLEPENAEILVKRAGVKMDGGDTEAALMLFDAALVLNADSTDALLHRANLYMIQNETDKAKADLERVIQIQPNHLLAHLRLATVFMTLQDLESANSYLKKAEKIQSNSSEVHSYRGEMHFAKGEVAEAKAEFEKATECDPMNATPIVNAALAVMNMPGPGGPPDLKEAVKLLEKALLIDPQFHTAYVHLGQLKLTMASNLTEARKVVDLYDKGLQMCCRTVEEAKDIVSMRILTVAQIDAAVALKMETLNMQ